jgi:subtilisin family serine protease
VATLDFRLQYLQQNLPSETRIHVLLQYREQISRLEVPGVKVTSVAGNIAAASLPISSLADLSKHPNVLFIGGARPLKDEMDVSLTAMRLTEPTTHVRRLPTLGRGAIIGIIDSGFELTHPCFRDLKGQTRIIAAWDQVNLNRVAGEPPLGFDYGIEIKAEKINQLAQADGPFIVRNQPGAGPHGTYVTGIAAGNGTPHRIFEGVAPEAELILVAYRNEGPVGGSAFVLDAIAFIAAHARARGLPVVVNISQGDNLGAHDGTSLLERAMDNLLRDERMLVVTSAGNERGGAASHHARGQVSPEQLLVLPFQLLLDEEHPVDSDTMDLWYRRDNRFSIALETPDGWRSPFIKPSSSAAITFPNGNVAQIYSEINYPTNGDNRIGVFLEKGKGWQPGLWKLVLSGDSVADGQFDVWADRSNGVTLIDFRKCQTDDSTVTLPGNGRRVITVGGFISRPEREFSNSEVAGALSPGSSIGPTRDGRTKPDLVAPSSLIMAPRLRSDTSSPISYDFMSGTSMAAPHVSGLIALIWSTWPTLKADHLRTTLCSTADSDAFTGTGPNNTWGSGKIDAEAAYKALAELIQRGESVMENRTVFEFDMRPDTKPDGTLAGMRVRIELSDGRITITGKSEGEAYEGLIVLRKSDEIAGNRKFAEFRKVESNQKVDGGDECYINGHWYNPCPVRPTSERTRDGQ